MAELGNTTVEKAIVDLAAMREALAAARAFAEGIDTPGPGGDPRSDVIATIIEAIATESLDMSIKRLVNLHQTGRYFAELLTRYGRDEVTFAAKICGISLDRAMERVAFAGAYDDEQLRELISGDVASTPSDIVARIEVRSAIPKFPTPEAR